MFASWFSVCLDQREINVKPGDNVTLPCQSPNDKAITLLEWSRPELKEDGYVFFYRNDRSYESYQHATVLGRVQLRDASMKDGDLSVILKNVNINDTGTYECRIINSNTEGRERDYTETKHVIHLTVTDRGESVELSHPWGCDDNRIIAIPWSCDSYCGGWAH